jgi:hypothetical protein
MPKRRPSSASAAMARHRHDLVAFYNDGLIAKNPFAIHWNDVDVHESHGSPMVLVGMRGKAPEDCPDQQTKTKMTHIHSPSAGSALHTRAAAFVHRRRACSLDAGLRESV